MEVIDIINANLRLQNVESENLESISNNLITLRNMCAKGSDVQHVITSNVDVQEFLRYLLFGTKYTKVGVDVNQLQTLGWQLMANLTVNNSETQSLVWQKHGQHILEECYNMEKPLNRNTHIMLMIMYNILKTQPREASVQHADILRAVVCIWRSILEQESLLQFDFLHFIFQEFLVNDGSNTVKCYAQLRAEEKLAFFDYLVNYLRQDSPNGLVHTFLLQHISKDFKIKSNCILRASSLNEIDKIIPQEAYTLLRCIGLVSGSELYTQLYATDYSLFLNVSSLLRCLVAASRNSEKNIFTPMNKLEEIAPSSTISADYRTEILYELKTLLVRCIANLVYNNPTNKSYCLDTQLLPVLFECIYMDARNPLMREWSIIAIQNACFGYPEIQQVIADLTQQRPASNDILTELNLDLGSLRINPNRD